MATTPLHVIPESPTQSDAQDVFVLPILWTRLKASIEVEQKQTLLLLAPL